MGAKSKTDSKFSRVSFGEFQVLKTWRSCNHKHFIENAIFLLKSVRANLINIFRKVTNYRILEKLSCGVNNLDFLPIQNVRQYHFQDVAKYEKISPKESVDKKEFRSKWGIYLPVIR